MFTSSSLHKLAATVTVGAFAVALTACGGGGGGSDAVASSGSSGASYSGSTSAAVVSDANKDQAARASIEGTTAAVEADGVDSLPVGVAAVVTDSSASAEPASPETIERVKAIVLQMAEQQGVTGEMVSGVTVAGECGGSFTIGGDGTTTKITYNNYCIDDGEGQITISGKVIVKTLGEDSTQITYQNMVVTSGGVTERLPNITITCDSEVCTATSDFTGSNGVVYRIENPDVTRNMDDSYDVSVRVYDAELGYVEVVASGITFCEEGISGGTITITNATEFGEDVVVNFSGCNAYTVNIIHATL